MSPDFYKYAARLLVMFAVLPVHEAAHAWASYKLGDPTAKNMGRLSLNPLRHLDLMGSICLLAAGIGWAKPVPIDPRYYANAKRGMALSALAGPMSNLLMSFIALFISRIIYACAAASGSVSEATAIIYMIITYVAYINVALGIFNLLPFPPFDGSRIMLLFLPERLYFGIMRYERYIMLALFALIFLGVFNAPLNFLENAFINGATRLIDGIISLFVRAPGMGTAL